MLSGEGVLGSQEALGWLKVQSVSVREAGHVDTEVPDATDIDEKVRRGGPALED